jgi:hypothetical protein
MVNTTSRRKQQFIMIFSPTNFINLPVLHTAHLLPLEVGALLQVLYPSFPASTFCKEATSGRVRAAER